MPVALAASTALRAAACVEVVIAPCPGATEVPRSDDVP